MNDRVKAELIEEFMPRAVEIALEMNDGSMPVEDLTQEAYLGLVTGIEAIARAEESDEYDRLPLEETVDEAIRMQVRAALKAEADLKSRDDELIARVSALNAAIEYLTESFGGKPTVDEIANQMDIPQEEVMEIMKLMGETIPEDEAEKGPSGDDFWINNPDMRGFRS